MKNEQIHFRILLRSPKYPAIVVAADDILPAFNIKELGTACYFSEPFENGRIKVIDNTGEEFLYMPDQIALFPGIARRKWTKARIIDLFNNSETAKEGNMKYSPKSLSNKRVAEIVNEICHLLGHNNRL
jgi:hypothetical protein